MDGCVVRGFELDDRERRNDRSGEGDDLFEGIEDKVVIIYLRFHRRGNEYQGGVLLWTSSPQVHGKQPGDGRHKYLFCEWDFGFVCVGAVSRRLELRRAFSVAFSVTVYEV